MLPLPTAAQFITIASNQHKLRVDFQPHLTSKLPEPPPSPWMQKHFKNNYSLVRRLFPTYILLIYLHTTYLHTTYLHTTYLQTTYSHTTYLQTTYPHTTYLYTSYLLTTCLHTTCIHTTYLHTTYHRPILVMHGMFDDDVNPQNV